MSSNKLSSKLSELKKKAVEIQVIDVPSPVVVSDLLSQFKAASAGTFDVANEFIIDVFPNFIPMLCYVMMLANRIASSVDYKTHAKASPPTIIAYYVTIIYAYFLVCDTHVRPVPSIHARIWKTDSTRFEFLKFLMSLPVPDDLILLLTQFAPTSTERTKNVFFIPSAAGFEHSRFFGKFIPIKSFFDIHNCVASTPGNASPGTIYSSLFKRATAYTVNLTTTTQWTCNLGDILGLHTDGNAINAPATRLFQIFENIFNPVLFRDFHRRSSLARIPLDAPEFDSVEYNPYDALLSYTDTNASELEVVLRTLSSTLASTVTMKKSLSQVIAESSGNHIYHHGYSATPLPTSSYNSGISYSGLNKDTELTSMSLKAYATKIGFLQATNVPAATTAIPEIKVTKKDDGSNASTTHRISSAQWPMTVLRHAALTGTDIRPKDSDFVTFDPTVHVAPRVRVLDINGTQATDAYLASLCGKVIETLELDGQTISLPNTDMSLGLENSSFADSALPITLTIPSSQFDHTDTITGPPPPQRRIVEREDLRFSASHLLVDRTVVRLPWIDLSVRDSAAPTLLEPLPGMTYFPTNWVQAARSFIGLKTIAPDAATTTTDSLQQIKKKSVYAWSPYTVTTRQDPRSGRNSSSFNRTYFLINLRTLFGTDYNLIEINGALHAMPCS